MDNDDNISAEEIAAAFPPDVDLLTQVRLLKSSPTRKGTNDGVIPLPKVSKEGRHVPLVEEACVKFLGGRPCIPTVCGKEGPLEQCEIRKGLSLGNVVATSLQADRALDCHYRHIYVQDFHG